MTKAKLIESNISKQELSRFGREMFVGWSLLNGVLERQTWIYNVRVWIENSYPDLRRLEKQARERKLVKTAKIGLGEITCIPCSDMYALCAENIEKDPWFLAQGPKTSLVEQENRRIGQQLFNIDLSPKPSDSETLREIQRLPRDVLSDGYDAVLKLLAKQTAMTIYEYASGVECAKWFVPEKWTCHGGVLMTKNGQKILSYAQNHALIVSYSRSFEGVVSRQELLEHLWVHPQLYKAIPVKFLYYDMDWGFCCSQEMRSKLIEKEYKITIRSDLSYSTLKIGKVVISGVKKDGVMFCIPICDRKLVNDAFTGIAVGLELFRELLQKNNLKYTYHILFVPQNFNSALFFQEQQVIVSSLKGVIFLDSLGSDNQFILKFSDRTSDFAQCFLSVFKPFNLNAFITDFSFGSDFSEYKFDSLDINIPLLSLTGCSLPLDVVSSEDCRNKGDNSGIFLFSKNSLIKTKKLIMNACQDKLFVN